MASIVVLGDSQVKYLGQGNENLVVYAFPGRQVQHLVCHAVRIVPLFNTLILHVGTNNVSSAQTISQIVSGFELLLDSSMKANPLLHIVVAGVLPRHEDGFSGNGTPFRLNDKAKQLNIELQSICRDRSVQFLALWDRFLSRKFIGKDGLHLSARGSDYLRLVYSQVQVCMKEKLVQAERRGKVVIEDVRKVEVTHINQGERLEEGSQVVLPKKVVYGRKRKIMFRPLVSSGNSTPCMLPVPGRSFAAVLKGEIESVATVKVVLPGGFGKGVGKGIVQVKCSEVEKVLGNVEEKNNVVAGKVWKKDQVGGKVEVVGKEPDRKKEEVGGQLIDEGGWVFICSKRQLGKGFDARVENLVVGVASVVRKEIGSKKRVEKEVSVGKER